MKKLLSLKLELYVKFDVEPKESNYFSTVKTRQLMVPREITSI
jgi:hypothetical protein